MQENLKNILPLVSDSNRIVIDFGGGGCPLGLGSIIVDKLKKDITGNAVKYHELTEIKGKVNVVFASHVFEHVQNLEQALNDIAEILNNDGHLICMVPSFSNPYWNAGGHNHEVFGPHVWTMGLSETDRSIISKIPFYIDIDTLISNYLKIEIAEYCGDDCIFILASKNVLSDNK
jgi:SAM-dependent methyltransferase